MNTTIVHNAIVDILRDTLAESTELLSGNWEKELEEIAEDAAHYALMAAQGDADAETLLEHLKVQAEIVAAEIVLSGNESLSAEIESVLLTAAKVAGIILKGLV